MPFVTFRSQGQWLLVRYVLNLPGGVAGVIDGSGYSATFCVSEEFGCNQWSRP